MITAASLKNFKSFRGKHCLPLGAITLLAGINGVGKSSFLQSLLLLRQSNRHGASLRLNGDLVELGQRNDALCSDADDDELAFSLCLATGVELHWRYQADDAGYQLLEQPSTVADCALFQPHCHYISADRWGPRRLLPMSEFDVAQGNLGKFGEYTAHYLVQHGDRQLADINPAQPLRGAEAGKSLLHQVQEWLNDIAPGTRLEPKTFSEVDGSVITFANRSEVGFSRGYRATNVGFGLSYTLPVIVALLSLPPGGLVILENPEAHLHPRGQTLMGRLMAQAAAAGVQVIVETHSDHVLNGIRLAVRERQLTPTDALFHYFTLSPQGSTAITSPRIDTDGRIEPWPAGFFDESLKSLAALSTRRPRALTREGGDAS